MYKLKPLPYLYQDLEPYIDTHTMGLHYHKHLAKYLDNLNNLLHKNHYDYRYPIEELPKHIEEFPVEDRENILFNLGGVLNHDIYFRSMREGKILPTGTLEKNINHTFGGYDKFVEQFKKIALSLKGSGYTFLVLDKNNKLRIINLANQETPYSYGLFPIIGLDLWEHAYYINYENKKDLYIDNFFDVVNFQVANELFGR